MSCALTADFRNRKERYIASKLTLAAQTVASWKLATALHIAR
jgi:hypothetical protein